MNRPLDRLESRGEEYHKKVRSGYHIEAQSEDAVLIDATIVRSILVPSVLKILGTKAWYLPSWLNWIPNISIEGSTDKK